MMPDLVDITMREKLTERSGASEDLLFVQRVAVSSCANAGRIEGMSREGGGGYPGYGLARHFGYPTSEHLAALRCLGPSPIHRRSFAPVRAALR